MIRAALKKLFRGISSPWLGVALIGVAIVYLSAASIMPDRLADLFGGSSEDVYANRLLIGMAGAAMLNMILASLTRLKPDLPHLGGWLAHAGTIVLAVGAGWFILEEQHGQTVSFMVPRANFWTMMDTYYVPGKLTCHVSTGSSGRSLMQTSLPINSRDTSRTLDVPIAGLPATASARAVKYLSNATITDCVFLEMEASPGESAAGSRPQTSPAGGRRLLELSAANPKLDVAGLRILFHSNMAESHVREILDSKVPTGLTNDILMVITRTNMPVLAIIVRPDGTTESSELRYCMPTELNAGGGKVRVELLAQGFKVVEKSSGMEAGVVQGQALLIDSQLTDSSGKSSKISLAVPFGQFINTSLPATVGVGSGNTLELYFSQACRPLSTPMFIENTKFTTYAGTEVPKDYVCRMRIGRGENSYAEALRLNQPIMVGQFQVSQGSWFDDPRKPQMIVLEISSRPGLWLIWLGMFIIAAGLAFSVLVKPFLPGARGGMR